MTLPLEESEGFIKGKLQDYITIPYAFNDKKIATDHAFTFLSQQFQVSKSANLNKHPF